MDPNLPSPSPRKVKFAPKAPPRRDSKLVVTSRQAVAEDDGEEAQRFLTRRDKEHRARQGSKTEKKPPVQVTLTHGGTSTGLRSFGKQKDIITDNGSSAAKSEESILDGLIASMSTSESDAKSLDALTDAPTVKKKKEYQEPWDYNSNYPTTLPWRRPYSGDPELLDKEEFEEPPEYDETTLNSAKALGLLDQSDEQRIFLVQLHSNLPFGTNVKAQEKSTTSKGKEKATRIPKTSSISTDMRGKETSGSSMNPFLRQGCCLEDLLEGYIGKMLVYKSGDVKLKLGDILYDVSPGTVCSCAQSAAAINTSSKHFYELGELDKERMVITPNIDSLLD